MNDVTLKEGLRASVREAIKEAGVSLLKSTSMFPLSNRKASEAKQAA